MLIIVPSDKFRMTSFQAEDIGELISWKHLVSQQLDGLVTDNAILRLNYFLSSLFFTYSMLSFLLFFVEQLTWDRILHVDLVPSDTGVYWI